MMLQLNCIAYTKPGKKSHKKIVTNEWSMTHYYDRTVMVATGSRWLDVDPFKNKAFEKYVHMKFFQWK